MRATITTISATSSAGRIRTATGDTPSSQTDAADSKGVSGGWST